MKRVAIVCLLAFASFSCSGEEEGQPEYSDDHRQPSATAQSTVPASSPSQDGSDTVGETQIPESSSSRGSVSDTECTAGAERCADEETAERCTADTNRWETHACADGQACFAGRCRSAQTCAPADVRCLDDTREQICDDSGMGWVDRSCGPGELCLDGSCEAADCSPGVPTCRGDEVVACDEDGVFGDVERTCGAGLCQGGRCVDGCVLDLKGTVGCEFFAAKLDHMSPGDELQFAITISNVGSSPVAATITEGNGAEVTTVSVPAGALETVDLPRRDVKATSRSTNSFRISADGPITAHQFNPVNRSNIASTDASLLLPSTSLGTSYIVSGWPSIRTVRVSEGRAYFTVIATEDDTELTVTPTARVEARDGVPGLQPGESWTTTLARGEVISFGTPNESGHDLHGSVVQSDRAIAVFSGHMCADVPIGTCCCDHMEQQMIPVETWGTEVVASKFASRGSEVDIWRILAAEDGTEVTLTPAVDGTTNFSLDAGETREISSGASFLVQATGPILAGQYMVGGSADGVDGWLNSPGDPALTLNPSTAQYLNDYIVLVPTGFDENHLTLVVSSGETVSLNGTPVSGATVSTIPGTDWEIWHVEVSEGVQRLEGSAPFGLSVHGYADSVSYAYPGGMNLEER